MRLLGIGESNDARTTCPRRIREGVGARLAMERALTWCSGLRPGDIDYVNLHGTATRVGDAAEDAAVAGVFGDATPRGSTKGQTGHTLGAAGIVEAIISALAIEHGILPGSPHTETIDPAFRGRYQRVSELARVDRVLSNSFGFGGSNCSLVHWASPNDPGVFLRSRRWHRRVLGLDGWIGGAPPVLAGLAGYEPAPYAPPPVTSLPPAERRRAGTAIRLAFAAGHEALTQCGRDPAGMAMVFASSDGDCDTVHEILCVLATERREVSPTRFHNSVHNAPAGYWAVATGSREPSTSLCAFDDSFSAGLLDAAAQATVDRRPVTLTAYDLPYPEPLHRVRPIEGLFATALVLTPAPTDRTIAALNIVPGWTSAGPRRRWRMPDWSGCGSATPRREVCPCSPRSRAGDRKRSASRRRRAPARKSTVEPSVTIGRAEIGGADPPCRE